MPLILPTKPFCSTFISCMTTLWVLESLFYSIAQDIFLGPRSNRDILQGTIPILRQHFLGLFQTHPLCQHKYSTERWQKVAIFWTNSPSSFAEVIQGWSPTIKCFSEELNYLDPLVSLQLNEYKTAPYFLQLGQNMTKLNSFWLLKRKPALITSINLHCPQVLTNLDQFSLIWTSFDQFLASLKIT